MSTEELTNQESTGEAPVGALEMSDDQFMDMGYEQFVNPQNEAEELTDTTTDSDDEDEDDEPADEAIAEDSEESADEDESDEADDNVQEETDESTEEETSDETEEETKEVDYKLEYEKILAPFKANGKEMKVDSIDDAIQLMKMGANYNKKMAAIKPNLKILKTLEKHKLLDENKLSYLIDLDKKDPKAINKLIKESGIDPLDIDVNSDAEYEPKTYTVDDKEVELDSVLEEIQDTPSYNQTIDIIGNKWDASSRQILVNNPSVIKTINEHVQNGMYAQIQQVIEKERMLGRLVGLTDIEAYKQVGDYLDAQGAFNHLNQQSNKQAVKPEPMIKRPTSKSPDPKLKERKKAASPTKSAPSNNTANDFNPLSMPDDEFEKMVMNKYI